MNHRLNNLFEVNSRPEKVFLNIKSLSFTVDKNASSGVTLG